MYIWEKLSLSLLIKTLAYICGSQIAAPRHNLTMTITRCVGLPGNYFACVRWSLNKLPQLLGMKLSRAQHSLHSVRWKSDRDSFELNQSIKICFRFNKRRRTVCVFKGNSSSYHCWLLTPGQVNNSLHISQPLINYIENMKFPLAKLDYLLVPYGCKLPL